MEQQPIVRPWLPYGQGALGEPGTIYGIPPAYLDIAIACYPNDWQLLDVDSAGMLLEVGGMIVGYASWHRPNRYMCDLAVHPDFRRYSGVLIRARLKMVEESHASWTTLARMSTGYRVLRSLAESGLIIIDSDELGYGRLEGEELRAVQFRVPSATLPDAVMTFEPRLGAHFA